MKRLNSKLLLIAPSQKQASKHFKHVQIDTKQCLFLYPAIKEFREQIFAKEGVRHQPQEDPKYSEKDLHAWHLIIKELSSDTICGVIRILFFEKNENFPSPEQFLEFAEAEFVDKNLKEQYLQRIQQYIEDIKRKNKHLLYVGGLAVSDKARKLGYGAILCLGANAFARIVDSAEGLAFTCADRKGFFLFQKLGAHLLDRNLKSFYCQYSRFYIHALALTPYNLPPSTEKLVRELESRLKTQTVLICK